MIFNTKCDGCNQIPKLGVHHESWLCDSCHFVISKPQMAKRYNSGKIDLTLIPVDAQRAEAEVWAKGAEKYGRGNWEKLWGKDTVSVVLASLLRHATAIQDGEINDPETGLQHAAHIRSNAAMLIRYFNGKETPKTK